MRVLASSVLTAEAFVVLFACLVAMRLSDISPGLVWAVGGSFIVVILLLCGLLRHRWALWVGSVLQLALIASGMVVGAMYAIGFMFALIWATALWAGARVDAVKAARAAAGPQPPGGTEMQPTRSPG